MKNILIITGQPFPLGNAVTNRILSIASGLTKLENTEIEVICYRSTENAKSIKNIKSEGFYKEIHYKNTSSSTVKHKNPFGKLYQNIYGLINLVIYLFKKKSVRRIDGIIIYTNWLLLEIIIFLFAKISKTKLLKDESEYPDVYFWKEGLLNSINKYLYKKIAYQLYDGLLLITHNLVNYFSKIVTHKTSLLYVPMTVDFERFFIKDSISTKSEFITYCGLLNQKKDGILDLIESFKLVSERHPYLKLMLIGPIVEHLESNFSSKILREKIAQLGLNNYVNIIGEVDSEKIPKYLIESLILILPRPASRQSEGGFPTKLGEYLATGNPVIATYVGEIPEYLKDGVNAFLAIPGDVHSIANKIEEVLLNYTKALQIGEAGRNTALKYFSNVKISKTIMMEFFKE